MWLTVANLLTMGAEISPIVPSFVVANFQDELIRWVRAAELSCDRAALLVSGDPQVVVSVLMKLSGGTPKLAGQLNVDAFLDRRRAATTKRAARPWDGTCETRRPDSSRRGRAWRPRRGGARGPGGEKARDSA